jgi:tetratricopeptide (TPR) repeat protein
MLRLDADFVPTYASIRELHEQKGDLALAIKWGRQALERDPDNGFYLSDLAILYFSLGDFESIDRIRTDMHARLEPGHWRLPWLEWNVFQAHGNMREMLDVIEKLPPPMADAWYINALKANTYFNLDDLTKAREYWLLSDPQWDDPGQWEALISTDETGMDRLHACKYASILITLGETAGGEELLRQAIHYSENVLPGLIEDSHVSPSLGWCYLAAGSYDNALDFYEQRIAHGHISNWWREKNLPWWSALRDDPRYIAMVDEIERKLNEQRELVRQMDETGPMEQVL